MKYDKNEYLNMLESIRKSLAANDDKLYLTIGQWERLFDMTEDYTDHVPYAEFIQSRIAEKHGNISE